MLVAPKFTEQFRQEELLRGQRSLFYFGVAILGFNAVGFDSSGNKVVQISDIHRDLAHFLEGRRPHYPWSRALVCAFRGVGKSIWTTQTYPMWRGLYIPNFSTKVIENSADNAKRNHHLPLVELFTTSPRADYLQWLYEHRIPSGFAGWTTEQIKLVQTDPLANPCYSYWGVESAFEGAHPDLIVNDDLDGADADKSPTANEDSWRAYQSTIPLLKHQMYSQILIVGTPHGIRPIVWRVREEERRRTDNAMWLGDNDNSWSKFKIFWRPVLNARGEPAWPERIPMWKIQELMSDDIFDTQYMLRKSTTVATLFNMEAVRGSAYTLRRDSKYTAIYPGFDYDPAEPDSSLAHRRTQAEPRVADLRYLRYYLHFDPLHRAADMRKVAVRTKRPAEAAAVVVGVTPDYHALCVDYWHGDGDIDRQLFEVFRLYCKWCPVLVTYESVGAQEWLVSLVRNYEGQSDRWQKPQSTDWLGTSIELPRMSVRMVPTDKSNQPKEAVFRDVLSSWVNRGLLHFRVEQAAVLHQLENALSPSECIDLVDCLSHGPPLWSVPRTEDKNARKYAEYVKMVNARLASMRSAAGGWAARVGYTPPWQRRQN